MDPSSILSTSRLHLSPIAAPNHKLIKNDFNMQIAGALSDFSIYFSDCAQL